MMKSFHYQRIAVWLPQSSPVRLFKDLLSQPRIEEAKKLKRFYPLVYVCQVCEFSVSVKNILFQIRDFQGSITFALQENLSFLFQKWQLIWQVQGRDLYSLPFLLSLMEVEGSTWDWFPYAQKSFMKSFC